MSRVEMSRVESCAAPARTSSAWNAADSRAAARSGVRPVIASEVVECVWRVASVAVSAGGREMLAARGVAITAGDELCIAWRVERGGSARCMVRVREADVQMWSAHGSEVVWMEQSETGLTHVDVRCDTSNDERKMDPGSLAMSFEPAAGRLVYARTRVLKALGIGGGRCDLAKFRIANS